MVSARREIEMLWAELMLSEEEMSDFGGFIDGMCVSGQSKQL